MMQTLPSLQPNAEICWFVDSSAAAGMPSLTSGFKTLMPRPASTKIHKKCLTASEDAKKKKHQKKCFEQRRDFVPFVVSIDGMFGPEAINTLKWIAQLLSEKWRCPCSCTFGCVKSCMSIAVVRTTNLCLRGARMENHSLNNRRYLWDEEGLCRLHNQHF